MNLNKLKIYNKQLQDLPQDRKRNRTPAPSLSIRESTSSFASSSSSKTKSSGVRRPSKVSKVEGSGDKGMKVPLRDVTDEKLNKVEGKAGIKSSMESSKTKSSGVRRPSKVSKVEGSGDKGRGKSEAAGVKAIKLIVL